MSPGEPDSRAEQKQPLHGALSPGTFYSPSPQPSVGPTPHRSNVLRNASTSEPPAESPGLRSTFSIVIGSSPPKSLASASYGSLHSTTKKRGRPFKNSRETPTKTIPKKKGRPFKNPQAAAAAAAAAAKAAGISAEQFPKKRGRPFKYPQGPEEITPVIPPEPNFIPFICEWKNCPAELHNLDTLRAHLLTVHLWKQPYSGPYMCLWRRCGQEYRVMAGETGSTTIIDKGVEFKTKEEWQNHVKAAHLDPVAWYQGDGPSVAISFTKKPQPEATYTFASGGEDQQVTPSVRTQPLEGGRAKVNNAARFRRQRDGLYVVLVPVENPAAYMKADDDNDGDAGDKARMDEK